MTKNVIILLTVFAAACAPSASATITQPPAASATPISSATISAPTATATMAASRTPQATATPEEESFAEPTLDNVEIMGNEWLERWTKDQFPLPSGTVDGDAYFNLGCINDEIITNTTGQAEIMSPDGKGTGIYLMAGAECWYTESGQDYAVLTPLVITDHQQMVIAGHAIQDHDPDYERATEENWGNVLDNIGFIGRGHIFLVGVQVPGNRVKGSNQGLGNEELGVVYTQELIEQFANGNGDPSMLPFVVIDGVKYYVLPPFDIGMRTTLNRVGKNPYATSIKTPIPPAATIDPNAVHSDPLLKFIENLSLSNEVNLEESFLKNDWDYDNAKLSDAGTILLEPNENGGKLFYGAQEINPGSGILIKFKIDEFAGMTIALTQGVWQEDSFRFWGVIGSGSRLRPLQMKGTPVNTGVFEGEIIMAPDNWYYLFLGEDNDGKLFQMLWTENDPSTYRIGYIDFENAAEEPYHLWVGDTGKGAGRFELRLVEIYELDGFSPAPEIVEQATATPEEESFTEPTLDNVEIMGNEWL